MYVCYIKPIFKWAFLKDYEILSDPLFWFKIIFYYWSRVALLNVDLLQKLELKISKEVFLALAL